MAKPIASLNIPVNGNEPNGAELMEKLAESNEIDPHILSENSDFADRMDELVSTLSAREAKIIRLRFGLIDGRPMALWEIGEKFGLTRERIRQIEVVALGKLRLALSREAAG